ncbi:Pesticin receptor [Zhongshania aliphaticivorans]|uniref:Pesticin receptor n=1 Tax=Zhongshania aliphaticivorans TaxID=1470434 RepID=A0A5S9NSG0_9GAMM|nr:TonB-dependent receptor [Zhongshania aliphaticivorans]CAA0093559.1 Pesticin receptor [Zhongshania aliphaticivorans]CAA0111533.1 Pesticin receptor [Zhongshania aliphaticivorans]
MTSTAHHSQLITSMREAHNIEAQNSIKLDNSIRDQSNLPRKSITGYKNSFGLLTFSLMATLLPTQILAAALEEVVVTAQKRTESVQDVPVAVTALSSEAMRDAGVVSTTDLTDVNPSISFDVAQSSQNASLKIRGIGSVGNGRTFEGAVGVFIDGVYRSRSGMALTDLNDIAGLEILRGPQGTLFGKNTVAGALSMTSAKPDMDAVSGGVELITGSYNQRLLKGAVTIPVNDKHALRFAAIANKQDGFYESPDQDKTFNDINRYGLKAQWLFDVSDKLSSLLIADYTKSDAECCFGSVQVTTGPVQPGIELFANHRGLTTYTEEDDDAKEKRLTNVNSESVQITEDYGLTWQLDFFLKNVDIKSITGLRRFSDEQIDSDADFGPAHILTFDEPSVIDFISQEFNFSWAWGPSDIVAGLYYSYENFESTRSVKSDTDANSYVNYLILAAASPEVALATCTAGLATVGSCGDAQLVGDKGEAVSIEDYHQESTSLAAFIHSQTELSEKWNLIAGLRYSYDSKEGGFDNIYWYNSPVAQAIVNSGAVGQPPSGDLTTPRNAFDVAGIFRGESFNDKFSSGEVTGTLAVQYQLNDDVNTYLSFGRGYKSGAVNLFNEAANFDNTTYDPEYASSAELGLKSRYLDGSAQTNIAIFYTKYTDLQLNFFNGLNFFTENAGEAVSQGIELENLYQVNENFRAELSITALDATFGDLNNGPEFTRFLTDRDTPRAPELAAVATMNYIQPLTQKLELSSRISASYNGSYFSGVNAADEKQDSYTLWDLSVGLLYAAEMRDWEMRLSCKNCTDVAYESFNFATTLQAGSYNAYINDPRQISLSLSTQF